MKRIIQAAAAAALLGAAPVSALADAAAAERATPACDCARATGERSPRDERASSQGEPRSTGGGRDEARDAFLRQVWTAP